MSLGPLLRVLVCALLVACTRTGAKSPSSGPSELTIDATKRHQTIDGFGTTGPSRGGELPWVQQLYYEDLGASILRIDLTPAFKSPYSDQAYNSPWFHNAPALPGPEGNNVRTYTDASDYGREWSGRRAAIAVMGPNIEQNLAYFDYSEARVKSFGDLAVRGLRTPPQAGDFKLVGSLWSPAPWLKRPSGGSISGQTGILPKNGTRWPFIWAGNFAGGSLDVSGKPLAVFDDKPLGGTGPTSALTQFARGLAAYLLGFQRAYGVRFHAISIQNELGFETFYNSCAYPRADSYIVALKAARAELDRHQELASIRIMGPEDLLGSSGYSLWQYGSEKEPAHKNLRYLAEIARDPRAAKALDFFCIHGYAPDGVTGAGADPSTWRMWTEGWSESPSAGLPSPVRGFMSYRKKSWMTETSGEQAVWLPPRAEALAESALGLSLKIHQALTAGMESAWIYWQLVDEEPVSVNTLTDAKLRERSPKYVAAKHYFRFIRPGATRVELRSPESSTLFASAYVHDTLHMTTVVLVNTGATSQTLALRGLADGAKLALYTSQAKSLWQESTPTAHAQTVRISVPARAVVTLVATSASQGR